MQMHVREELTGRLKLGLPRCDDTRNRVKEALLDSVIYIVADYIRVSPQLCQTDEPDDNKLIMSIIDEWGAIESPQHKMLLWNLLNMLNSNLFSGDK